MALAIKDRVLETTTTTGTGTLTLAGAVTGYQAWSAVGDGNTAYYCAYAVDANGVPSGDWEVGLGTYTASGTTLARTTVLASSNGGSAVNFGAGTKRVAAVNPATICLGGTLVAALTLAENTGIALDPAGSADGKWSGITVAGIGGATIAFGDLVTLDKDDSRWELVDISVAAAATGDARGILGMAVTSSSDGAAITVLLCGIIRADANFPALTIGAPVYASTAGDVVVAQPTTADYVIRIVGYGLTADELFFNPGNAWITHT